ncbi:predicted protein [Histoplasma capsulatum G186AR]|uniref:Uncharacterized protein n=1 Tax=Ajellomyces capsulatus (strain G186AR / H82 / ATCC MYA-2454 / RMSCC 2432) TaxID=447093 RepID=C0NLS6_AJECG|nr:uncharacterized protein HCBG_04456 [Histoplasma capsulatum G186AR]EEH07577.1 predicted protein [Histoplasma capsulatum G186AR]
MKSGVPPILSRSVDRFKSPRSSLCAYHEFGCFTAGSKVGNAGEYQLEPRDGEAFIAGKALGSRQLLTDWPFEVSLTFPSHATHNPKVASAEFSFLVDKEMSIR